MGSRDDELLLPFSPNHDEWGDLPTLSPSTSLRTIRPKLFGTAKEFSSSTSSIFEFFQTGDGCDPHFTMETKSEPSSPTTLGGLSGSELDGERAPERHDSPEGSSSFSEQSTGTEHDPTPAPQQLFPRHEGLESEDALRVALRKLENERTHMRQQVSSAIEHISSTWIQRTQDIVFELGERLRCGLERAERAEEQLKRANARIAELEAIVCAQRQESVETPPIDKRLPPSTPSRRASMPLSALVERDRPGSDRAPSAPPPERPVVDPEPASGAVAPVVVDQESTPSTPARGADGTAAPGAVVTVGAPKGEAAPDGSAQRSSTPPLPMERPRRLGILKALSQTPFSKENDGHKELLEKLRRRMYPNEERFDEESWDVLGFEEAPEVTYEREHVLALHQLAYFSERCKTLMQSILEDGANLFPVGVIGLHLTSACLWLLDDNSLVNGKLDKTFLGLMAHPKAFEEIYCIAFRIFRRTWNSKTEEERRNLKEISAETMQRILSLLEADPKDLQELLSLFAKQEEQGKWEGSKDVAELRTKRARTQSEMLPMKDADDRSATSVHGQSLNTSAFRSLPIIASGEGIAGPTVSDPVVSLPHSDSELHSSSSLRVSTSSLPAMPIGGEHDGLGSSRSPPMAHATADSTAPTSGQSAPRGLEGQSNRHSAPITRGNPDAVQLLSTEDVAMRKSC